MLALNRRVVGLGLAGTAAVGIALGLFLWSTSRSPTGHEPSARVETRDVGPSGQLGPVKVIVPNLPASPGAPRLAGPFKILPWGTNDGPQLFDAPPQGTQYRPGGRDVGAAEIAASGLDAVIGYTASGFTLAQQYASVVLGDEIKEVTWEFHRRDLATIEITRRYRLPFEIAEPATDSAYALREQTIDGHPAIAVSKRPGTAGPQMLYVIDGDIVTIITADLGDFGELTKLAESIDAR